MLSRHGRSLKPKNVLAIIKESTSVCRVHTKLPNTPSNMFPRKISYIVPICLGLAYVLFLIHISFPGQRSEEKVVIIRECPLETERAKLLFFNISQVQEQYIGRGEAADTCLAKRPVDDVKMHRDIFDYERRGTVFAKSKISEDGVEKSQVTHQFPGQIPGTAHVVWCGEKTFTFADYLSVLSIVRVLEPQKLVFHYNFLPTVDEFMYNLWWQELQQSLPSLVMRGTDRKLQCGSFDTVRFGLEQLGSRADGGIYVGAKTLITHIPSSWASTESASYFGNADHYQNFEHGIMYTRKQGATKLNVGQFLQNVLATTFACVTEKEFESVEAMGSNSPYITVLPPCLVLTQDIHPKDIMNSTSRLAEFARWLYYGKTARLHPVPGPDVEEELIPNTCHMILINPDSSKSVTWPFNAYISVLSALYLAKFDRVYIHGNVKIVGKWWDRLKGEKITHVEMDMVETVFQTRVDVVPHNTDVMRAAILMKYGGVYMDWDIIWANPIPRHVRRYPAVFSTDWPRYGDFPGSFNLGVLMGKPKAKFLRLFSESFRYYRDDLWQFNAMLMPYKIWERHPDTLWVDKHLQVICFMNVCHPAWQDTDYIRDIGDTRPTMDFTLDEAISFHFTEPNFPPSMETIESMKTAKDMFGILGRKILRESGHDDLMT